MRQRILWVAMASVVLAVSVLGVPLAFAVNHILANDERAELEQVALRAAVTVSPASRTGDPVELPALEAGVQLAVYDDKGRRISGEGPVLLDAASTNAASGAIAQGDGEGQLVVVVPVSEGERVFALVRAASAESAVTARAVRWDLALLGGCLFAALCAAGLAAWQSRRLSKPLDGLAVSAVQLSAGDFSVRTQPSGVAEIDAAGAALNVTAERLAAMIDRERSFSTYASHQLRTPLAQLQLELESGLEFGGDALRTAATAAMAAADQLSQTIDDVLELARGKGEGHAFDVGDLLVHLEETWHGPLAANDRPLRVVAEEPLRVMGSITAARQIVHVLMDNALRHGRGTVTVRAREAHGAVAIDVVDQGTTDPINMSGEGRLGLPLARSLADAERGRLLVDQGGEGTRFTLLLPAAPESPDTERDDKAAATERSRPVQTDL